MRHHLALALFLVAAGLVPGRWGALAAAEAGDPQAKPGQGDPTAKITSSIRPYVVAPGRDLSALARTSVATQTPGTIAARLDVAVTAANLAQITATGAVITSSQARWNSVSIEATPAQLLALSRLAVVDQIALRRRPHHADEGDAVMHTDQLRTVAGVTGAGRTIGMISDSIKDTPYDSSGAVITGTAPNATLTGMMPQTASGHFLPASVQVVDFGPGGGTDEGEAMLEEVHAIAPGAPLAFGSADSTDTEMATTIGLLSSAAGCTVIGDDVSFLDEPFFQDGPIAQAIDAFRANGNLYFSAAGNNNSSGIMVNYVSVNGPAEQPDYPTPATGGNFNNWGQGGATPGYLPIVVPAGATLYFILEWNQPFHSYGLGAGSQADFDLYAYSSPAISTILAESNDEQGSAGHPLGDPLEAMEYTNSGSSSVTIYLAVDHYAGVTDAVLRLVVFSDGEWSPPSGSTLFSGPASFGHCTASGCLAIAAAPASAPGTVEPFSSRGGWGASGIPFYFDTAGNALNPVQLRNKPDLTAPDGVTTSNPGFDPFYGTSAATPNAAACAALVWQAQPNSSNTQIVSRLEATAGTVSSPDSPQPNDYTGYGMVNGLAAAATTAVTRVSTSDASGTLYGGSVPITVFFSQAVTVSGSPQLTLNTTPSRVATYVSGSGTNALQFSYTIVAGDQSQALDVAGTSALALNGGTILDALSNAPSLSVPAPGGAGSVSALTTLVIDAVGPTLTVSAPSTTSATTFTVTFTFSQPVVGFTLADISLSNGVAGTLTATGSDTYTLTVTASAPGAVTVSVGTIQNAYGQGSSAASSTTTYATAGSGGATTSTTSGGTTSATSGATTASSASGGGGGGGGGCGLGSGMGLLSLMAGLGWWRRRRG